MKSILFYDYEGGSFEDKVMVQRASLRRPCHILLKARVEKDVEIILLSQYYVVFDSQFKIHLFPLMTMKPRHSRRTTACEV